MTGIAIDKAGKVFLDGASQELLIDGVRVSLGVLPQCVNPSPDHYYQAKRRGAELTVSEWPREELIQELGLGKKPAVLTLEEETHKQGHSIAYDACCSMIDSNCLVAGEDGAEKWYDVRAVAPGTEDEVADAVLYLDRRRLIQRSAEREGCVCLCDEGEPLPEVSCGR